MLHTLKKPSFYLLAGIAALTLWLLFAPAASQMFQTAAPYRGAVPKQNGLMLDAARRFYSAEDIKRFVDDVARAGGTFLHLHLSDHENYALESRLLGQEAHNALRRKDGVYVNPKTGRPFLSFRQVADIARHAARRNIELIPEVGSPNHMNGIFELLEHKHGKAYADALKSPRADDEININRPQSVALVKALIDEVAGAFGQSSRHFHIGGDEFGYNAESNHEFVRYANTLAAHLAAKKLTPRMWNDGVIRPTVGQLDKKIEITYWSYDGDTQSRKAAQERRELRAGMPELLEKGFTVLNYNSYYLYWVPKDHENFLHDAEFAEKDIEKRWSLGVWDGENRRNAVGNPDRIAGAALAVWGEESGSLDTETIRRYASALLAAMIRKSNGTQ